MSLTGWKLVFVCSVFAGGVTFAAGQDQAPPPGQGPGRGGGRAAGPPQNLKVLPKDWSRPQVQQLMQTFVESLGVGAPAGEACAHCHTVDPTAPPPQAGRGPQLDFALDQNPNKDIARKMIQIVMALNADDLNGVGEATVKEKVTCYTCHQGKEKPALAPPNGWARGNFTLIPPGPTVPARRGGPGGAPAPAGAPADGGAAPTGRQ
jgi:hypothetical protein